MGEARSHRVFFALWPDEAAVRRLSALAQKFAANCGRETRPASLHLTLAFVGSVTSSQLRQLEGIAAGIRAEAFDLGLDRLGFWPQRGILWAGCRQSPMPLRRLVDPLVNALRAGGFALDASTGAAMVPHVTLARRVRCASVPQLEAPILWRVDGFSLVETHLHPSAADYKTLASFALDSGAAG